MTNWAKEALDCLLSMESFFETEDDRININISGTHYEINASVLFNFPDTILGDPLKRIHYLIPGKNMYFFPRHSSSFESILYYYINDGILIKSELIPAMIFYEEIRFFQLNEKLIQTFYKDYLSIDEDNQNLPNSSCKKFFWQIFIHPPITYFNSLFNIFSAVFNALAIFSLCLETMNIYRNNHYTKWMITHPLKPLNRTEGFQCSDFSLRPYHYIPYFNSENITLEILCVTWFVTTKILFFFSYYSLSFRFWLELFLRIISSFSLLHLINDPNFLLDIICILPTILNQILFRFYLRKENEETQLFDYLTCLKLFRLFRLTRYAKCLQIYLEIFYINLKDILRLTQLIIFGIFYFGLTQFVLEQMYQENEIKNIGEALWHVNILVFFQNLLI